MLSLNVVVFRLGPNVWPKESDLPEFRRDINHFYESTTMAAQGMFQGFALAMGWF